MRHVVFPAIFLLLVFSVPVTVCAQVASEVKPDRPNILFIAVDDLRPALGCYGDAVAKTPNIDRLASQGVLFTNTFCQQAICGPSRASLMTGLRPDSSGVVHNDVDFRDTVPDVVTLPEQLRRHGYQTTYVGKIYHGQMVDSERSWSRGPVQVASTTPVPVGGYQLPENQAIVQERREQSREKWGDVPLGGMACGPAFECADVPDNAYSDGRTTDIALATLRSFAEEQEKPFFFGVGFKKPHLPFVAPKRYWDLYHSNEWEPAENPFLGVQAPSLSVHSSFELRTRSNIPDSGAIEPALARQLLHAYFACASYIDAQVGRLMEALKRLGLEEKTIVILWGDHGWHLGEHGIWGKATNYEIATRVPMIVRVPGARANGQRSEALTELIDMYPTLCELSGIPVPEHVEGCSFAPLLVDADLPWKEAVFSQFPAPALREWAARPLSEPMRKTFFGPLIRKAEDRLAREFRDRYDKELFEHHVTGYAVRTPRYRMVRWVDVREPESKPLAVELYDLPEDPQENINLASQRRYDDIVEVLSEKLQAGYRKAMPPDASRFSVDWCSVSRTRSRVRKEDPTEKPMGGQTVLFQTTGSPRAKLSPLPLENVHWREGFWHDRSGRLHEVTLPVLRRLADDWAWHNMLVAAGEKEGTARGCFWEDAWVYKWIEAACYQYTQTGDPELLAECDRMIEVIAKAQQPDGYLATQITLRGEPRLSNYRHHEVYTMGHLLTAACAHHRVTGKTNFLDIARRVGDFLHQEYFSNENPYLINCPVNPSVVMGAVELYRTTGEKRYLELANIVIDNRGKPRPPVPHLPWGAPAGHTDLNQDRIPLRKSKEVVGHAVFWSYLYAGATDAYMETGDATIMHALDRLWNDVVSCKMHITGGVSPIHKGLSNRSSLPGQRTITNDEVHEAAGLPYQLPHATAYNETCGQIGFLMWNARILAVTGEAKYADTMERALYNAILSGVNLSGRGWSYTNPLKWHGPGHELLSNDYHGRMDPGDGQICCPTNLLRIEASWQGYLYGKSHEGLWVHHYAASEAEIALPEVGKVQLVQETEYPWDGSITITLDQVGSRKSFAIHLRIPGWAKGASLKVNGRGISRETLTPGSYLTIARTWKSGDCIEMELPMPVRLIAAHPKVEHAGGKVAVQRGPIVYCAESTDLPEGIELEQVRLPAESDWTMRHDPELLEGVTFLETTAVAVDSLPLEEEVRLYREYRPGKKRTFQLRMIPYYAWNNRVEPEMTVWLPLH